MRQIGSLATEQQANTFSDYLLTRGIKSTVDQEADQWILWIYDEDQLVQAREELATFLENPDDPIFREVAQTARKVRQETEKLNKKVRAQAVNVRDRWKKPLLNHCPITFGLIAVSILISLLTKLGAEHEPYINALSFATYTSEGNVHYYSKIKMAEIRNGEVWRLATPMFIHFGPWHILFNMLWMRSLGMSVEFRLRSLKYLMMVLVIAILSNTAQYLAHGPTFGGMSGVVFGLFGFVWMKSKFDSASGFYIDPTTVFLMIAWFFICMTPVIGAVANFAHGVGLAVGMILGYAPTLWRNIRR